MPKPVDTVLEPGPAEPRTLAVRARHVPRPRERAGHRVTKPRQ
jgi:hypothetical protein